MIHRGPFQPLPFCDSVSCWGRSFPPPAPCQSALSPNIGRGSPLATWFAMSLQVLCHSQFTINYPKLIVVGSATYGSSPPGVREAGCCSSPLAAWVHTCAKGSGMQVVATQVLAIRETCLYWHPHKHKQRLHKHQQHSQPRPIWRSGQVGPWQSRTQIPGS